ncbi:MAG TPA: S1 RNA-binding domain-containing protein [Streptosporangiaceae bacterium]|jgi:ribosomal protein S1|nr:S1 RNA-binding domain-containing protein [Streptosporangiaceae bacterium]
MDTYPDNATVPVAVWLEFLAAHGVGDAVTGRVSQVAPFGAFVEFGGGIYGLLMRPCWREEPEAGRGIEVRIGVVDEERRRISLQPA